MLMRRNAVQARAIATPCIYPPHASQSAPGKEFGEVPRKRIKEFGKELKKELAQKKN